MLFMLPECIKETKEKRMLFCLFKLVLFEQTLFCLLTHVHECSADLECTTSLMFIEGSSLWASPTKAE